MTIIAVGGLHVPELWALILDENEFVIIVFLICARHALVTGVIEVSKKGTPSASWRYQ